jgi:hypothetical protein
MHVRSTHYWCGYSPYGDHLQMMMNTRFGLVPIAVLHTYGVRSTNGVSIEHASTNPQPRKNIFRYPHRIFFRGWGFVDACSMLTPFVLRTPYVRSTHYWCGYSHGVRSTNGVSIEHASTNPQPRKNIFRYPHRILLMNMSKHNFSLLGHA